jgi:hypothetical protein
MPTNWPFAFDVLQGNTLFGFGPETTQMESGQGQPSVQSAPPPDAPADLLEDPGNLALASLTVICVTIGEVWGVTRHWQHAASAQGREMMGALAATIQEIHCRVKYHQFPRDPDDGLEYLAAAALLENDRLVDSIRSLPESQVITEELQPQVQKLLQDLVVLLCGRGVPTPELRLRGFGPSYMVHRGGAVKGAACERSAEYSNLGRATLRALGACPESQV